MSTGRPPGPRGGWLSGNLPAFEEDRLGFLLRTRDAYGPLVAFDVRTTLVHDPLLAREVLSSDSFVIRENFLQERLTADEIRAAGPVRSLLRPSLRRARVPRIAAIAGAESSRVLGVRADGAPFDPMPALEEITSTSIARYYFSDDGDEIPGLATTLLDELSRVIGNQFALPAAWRTPRRRRINAAYAEMHAVVLALLEHRARRSDQQDDVAGEVVVAAGAASISLDRVARMLIGSLLAAHRVPAAAASWALMLLADRPDLQGSLANEVAAAVDRPGASGDLAFVLEALRLYPATWLLARFSPGPAQLGGYSLGAQHHFLISPYVIHRDPDTFPDPLDFRPERWGGGAQQPAGYLPFGHGLRACPGRHLAVSMLCEIVGGCARRWHLEREGAVRPDPRTALIPKGLRLRLVPRAGTSAADRDPVTRSGGVALAGGSAEAFPRRLS